MGLIMKKITVLLHASISEYEDKKINYSTYSTDMSKYGCGIPVKEIDIEFDEPEYSDIVAGTISILREKKAEKRAEAELEVNNIEQKIQNLLCIENHSTVEVE